MEPEQWYQRAPELELLCDRRELQSWSCCIFVPAPKPWFYQLSSTIGRGAMALAR